MKRLTFFLLATFTLLLLGNVRASAQPKRTLPTVTDPTSVPSTFGSAPSPSDFNSMNNIPSPAVARSMAERAVSGLDSLTKEIQQKQSMIESLKNQLARLDDDVNRMRREKQQILAELRGGFYCSQCRRSKTEIEQGGENFEQHLVNVNGVKIAAPQSLIDEKTREYDQKIAELIARAEREKPRIENAIKQCEEENKNAWGKIQEGIDLWRAAVSLEQSLIVANEEATRKRELAEINAATQKIKELEGGDRIGSPDAVSNLNSELAMWKKIKAQAEANAEKRFSSYWQDINNSNKTRNAEYTSISGFLPRTTEYSQHMLTQYNAYGMLPPLNISTERVTGVPLSIKFENGQLGMGFKLGNAASMNLMSGPTSATAYETSAFFKLFSTYKIGVSWVTDYTLDGVQTGPRMMVESSAPKDKPIVNVPNRIEEKPQRVLPVIKP